MVITISSEIGMRRLFHMRSRERAHAVLVCLLLYTQGIQAQEPVFPPLGTIDFYGLQTISESEVRGILPIGEGHDFAADLPDPAVIGNDMTKALGVARVELNLVCCTEAGLSQLYVGVQEGEQARSLYFPAPIGDVELPRSIVENFEVFLDRMMESVLSGDASEDRSQGHALAESDAVRRTQETFLDHAEQHLSLLTEVLTSSSKARHRAIAAHVLGYASNKAGIAPVLASAVLDPDEGVRNCATRSLAVIAQFANTHPDRGIVISPDPFIDMLNSIVWSDRNKALGVLVALTETREARLLEQLRTNALDSLTEMCAWKHWGHAEPACSILRRIVGLPDDTDPSSRSSTLASVEELQSLRRNGPRN